MNSKIAPRIIGLIEKGKIIFSPTQQRLFTKHLESLEGYVTIKVEKRTQRRSLDQNALLWFWLTCLENETGQPKDDIHDYCKRKLLKRWITIKEKRVAVIGGTSTMNSQEFTEYLETFRNFVALEEEFSYVLPETYPSSFK